VQIREVTEAEAAAEEEDGVEYVDFNVAGVGQQRLTLRTAVMEDKLNACTMIVEYGQPTPPRCCQATCGCVGFAALCMCATRML
jgi:hypothetical protein